MVKEKILVATLILNEDKVIRGNKIKAGTVMGEIKSAPGFEIEDIDLAAQLNQIKINPILPAKEEAKKK